MKVNEIIGGDATQGACFNPDETNSRIEYEPSSDVGKEFHCEDQCPLCGSRDIDESDDFELMESSGHDKNGCFKDTINYRKHCNKCGAEFDQQYELGPYVCTGYVEKGEQG